MGGFPASYFQNYSTDGLVYADVYKELGGELFIEALREMRKRDLPRPKNMLELGAANGLVIRDALQYGLDAYGIEFSDYILQQIVPQAKGRIIAGNALTWLPLLRDSKFDLVIDTCAQYVDPSIVIDYLQELSRVCKYCVAPVIQYSDDPLILNDKQRRTFKPMEWWINTFKQVGLTTEDGTVFFKKL